MGAQGIAVSCSEADTVTPSIDKAVSRGVQVMCFDLDAPNSKRFAYYGTDDKSCGERTVDVLAKAMGEKGNSPTLAGNQSAPNLQNRVAGAKEALKKYPNMKLNEPGVFYHVETPEKAAEAVQQAQNANPSIQGWAMIGGLAALYRQCLKVAGGLDQSGGGRRAPRAAWLCQRRVCGGAPGPGLLWLGHQVRRDPARQDRQEPVPVRCQSDRSALPW